MVQLAERGRPQAGILPSEQQDAEEVLKDANLLADCPGGYVKRVRSGHNAAVANNGIEYLQRSKGGRRFMSVTWAKRSESQWMCQDISAGRREASLARIPANGV
ncbi:hypothetical protein WL46_15440 [Burkholderia ubonensis]|nr:hypothetical protein [Burkholderia ubonensis]KWC06286.1 hypothetical protein WL46_15440 [Burkholderia ubonensis]